MSRFQKATKHQAKLRMALIGPAGAGKTFTSLKIGTQLGRAAVIDSERGSASKYADKFSFDTTQLDTFSPAEYVRAIHEAEAEGFEVIIIDSLSHAWMGKDGALEMVDKVAARSKSGNNFTAWREVTPEHNRLVDAMLQARAHVIVTVRAKTEYVLEKDERTGKMAPRKVGMAPIQREGLDFEFDLVADVDQELNFVVSKSRYDSFAGYVTKKAGDKEAAMLRAELFDGAPLIVQPERPVVPRPAPSAPAAASDEQDRILRAQLAIQEAKTEGDMDVIGRRLATSPDPVKRACAGPFAEKLRQLREVQP